MPLLKLYTGTAQVPPADNYFAALNSAVFSDGSFVFIPKGVRCPMEVSTYFRINASETGQVQIPVLCWVSASRITGNHAQARSHARPGLSMAAGMHAARGDARLCVRLPARLARCLPLVYCLVQTC